MASSIALAISTSEFVCCMSAGNDVVSGDGGGRDGDTAAGSEIMGSASVVTTVVIDVDVSTASDLGCWIRLLDLLLYPFCCCWSNWSGSSRGASLLLGILGLSGLSGLFSFGGICEVSGISGCFCFSGCNSACCFSFTDDIFCCCCC